MSQDIQDWALEVSTTSQNLDAGKNDRVKLLPPISSDDEFNHYSDDWNTSWGSEDSHDDEDVADHSRHCVLDSSTSACDGYGPYNEINVTPPSNITHKDLITFINASDIYKNMLAQLATVRAHGRQLLWEQQKLQSLAVWYNKRQIKSTIQLQRHIDYAAGVEEALERLRSGVKKQYNVDFYHTSLPRANTV